MSKWTAGLVLSLSLICGYSQQAAATDDLIHALTDAHSAPDGHTIYFNRNFNNTNPDFPGKTDEDLYITTSTRGHP